MKERIAYWDNVRFFLIILVVIGHGIHVYDSKIFSALFLFIYSFHMPLFVLIAGMFHKNENIEKRVIGFFVNAP